MLQYEERLGNDDTKKYLILLNKVQYIICIKEKLIKPDVLIRPAN